MVDSVQVSKACVEANLVRLADLQERLRRLGSDYSEAAEKIRREIELLSAEVHEFGRDFESAPTSVQTSLNTSI